MTIDFNEVFLTNHVLRKQVAKTLQSWGLDEKPERPELGICFNLKMLYPNYRFDLFVMCQSMNWSQHKMAGKASTAFPVCDSGYSSRKWQNPQRLDLCRFLSQLLSSEQ